MKILRQGTTYQIDIDGYMFYNFKVRTTLSSMESVVSVFFIKYDDIHTEPRPHVQITVTDTQVMEEVCKLLNVPEEIE